MPSFHQYHPQITPHQSIYFYNGAVLDPGKAWKGVAAIDSFGLGNSKANSLLWTASLRPDYDRLISPVELRDKHLQAGVEEGGRREHVQCEMNSACDATGMWCDVLLCAVLYVCAVLCCVMFYCMCCAVMCCDVLYVCLLDLLLCCKTGVQGKCCPAAEGVFLGCCPHILPESS
jgi:hypothetical protein